jgi:hypothetical protein
MIKNPVIIDPLGCFSDVIIDPLGCLSDVRTLDLAPLCTGMPWDLCLDSLKSAIIESHLTIIYVERAVRSDPIRRGPSGLYEGKSEGGQRTPFSEITPWMAKGHLGWRRGDGRNLWPRHA